MDERDASLQSLKEKYQQTAQTMNEDADTGLSEAIKGHSERRKKGVEDAEKAANEMADKASAAAKAAIREEDGKAFEEIRSLYAAYGVRK